MDPNLARDLVRRIVPPMEDIDAFFENDGNLPFRLREQLHRLHLPAEQRDGVTADDREDELKPEVIYLLKDEAFVWTADPAQKQKKCYKTDILHKWNLNDCDLSSSSDEKSRGLKALEKICGTNFPLDIQSTAPLSLVRSYSEKYRNYIVSFEANLADEFFKRLWKVVDDIILTATLKIDDGEHSIEMQVKDGVLSTMKGEFCRDLNCIVGRKLKNGENVNGLLSVRLSGEASEDISDRYESVSLGEKLLEDKTTTDCTLVSVDGGRIECHQLILKLHSPVLSSMLASDSEESDTQEIKLETMTKEGLRPFLNYIYCWDISEAKKNVLIAVNMLYTAHAYKMKDLEMAMIQLFGLRRSLLEHDQWYATAKGFSITEILDLFIFANDIGESYRNVMNACVFMLKCHQTELEQSEAVIEFLASKPELGARLLALTVKDFDKL